MRIKEQETCLTLQEHDDDDDDDEVSLEIAITGMYSRIPWKLVADPLGCAEHNLGPTGL